MSRLSKNYYLFLGFHGFLLGLFPFFLPVFLYKNGATLAEISWFIAITGLGFCISLFVVDHFRNDSCLGPIIVSFVLETLLLVLLLLGAPLPLIAVVNGGYSCLYWTIQRVLFLKGGSTEDSGRRFGNFQIYVLLVLKTGVFVGGVLLEHIGIWAVFLLSLIAAAAAARMFVSNGKQLLFPEEMQQQKPLKPAAIVSFSDTYNSRPVFALDGIFLYLESYFWLISLFLIVGESFVRLGLLVIVLAIILGAIFLLIKNSIDRVDTGRIYSLAVILYAISWALRGSLSEQMNYTLQLSLILGVAFCTSFFRLAFNKRFFDNALRSSLYHYLFIKSYFSQLVLAVGFGLIGLLVAGGSTNLSTLNICYWIGCFAAGLYLIYLPAGENDPNNHEIG